MHHAQRSVRVVRPGARTAATAAAVKAKPVPSKWTLPESSTDAASSSSSATAKPLSNLSKWGLPSSDASQSAYNGFRPLWKSSSAQASSNTRLDRSFALQDRNASKSTLRDPIQDILRSGSNTQIKQPLRSPVSRSSRSDRDTINQGRSSAPHFTSANSRQAPPHRAKASEASVQARLLKDTAGSRTNVKRFVANVNKLSELNGVELSLEKQSEAAAQEIDAALKAGEEVETELGATLIEDIDDVVLDVPPVGHHHTRQQKLTYKHRGSLVSRVDDQNSITSHSVRRKQEPVEKKRRITKLGNRAIKTATIDVYIPSIISVSNLARLLKVRLGTLQRAMIRAGMSEDVSHDHMLSSEYSSLLAMEFGRNPVVDDEAAFDIHPRSPPNDKTELPSRPPVVTIMGHVDHGKTTLLDTLRSASVAKGEAGGITQHIGAFSVPVKGEAGRIITFLDTPGHAAFSAMRARGAGVTDIVVLVVAADDGVMPQTREVLELVKKDSDNVSLVVAINKVDKPGADTDKVEKALLAEGVQLETFGGDVPCVHVSGLTGEGLDHLVETISLVAEMQDLRAEKDGQTQGFVLESRLQKGLGPVATVLLLRGSLTPGTHLICGSTQAKVRRLTSPSGTQVKLVHPGEAVVVSGWKDLPGAGDEVLSGSEADVKKALANRVRKAEIEATLQDVDAINSSRREERERREQELVAKRDNSRGQRSGPSVVKSDEDEQKELKVLVKGDVSGSVEAVAGAIQGIGNHLASVKIVATGVGEVTESDVMRAKAAEGVIVAFSVKAPKAIESLAVGQGVPIVSSSVIYRLMDAVKDQVIKLLPVTIERRVRGEATVLEIFDIHLKAKKIMKVAGCRVSNGVVEKSKSARVVRNGDTVFEGRLDTFRHLKKDITEAGKGLECGISLEGYSELQAGDMIQMYEEIEIPGSL